MPGIRKPFNLNLIKYVHVLIAAGLCFLIACSKHEDKKPVADATIQGQILNINDNSPVDTEEPNGIRIRLIGASPGMPNTPVDCWVQAGWQLRTAEPVSWCL